MKFQISCNARECIRAGLEPADSIEVDLGALNAEERELLAGVTGRVNVTVPTVVALVAAARAKAEAIAAEAAKRAEILTEFATALAEQRTRTDAQGYVYPDLPFVSYLPEDLSVQADALRQHCNNANDELRQQKEKAAAARMLAGIATRAAMSEDQLQTEFCLGKVKPKHPKIVTDDGQSVVIGLGVGRYAPFRRYAKIKLPSKDLTVELAVDDEAAKQSRWLSGYEYAVDDGVLTDFRDQDAWVAKVADPGAMKPIYEFAQRVPGGRECPHLVPGDVLVWGGRDRKGRKTGPFDRLVVFVTDTKIYTIGGSYAELRKLRRLLRDAQTEEKHGMDV